MIVPFDFSDAGINAATEPTAPLAADEAADEALETADEALEAAEDTALDTLLLLLLLPHPTTAATQSTDSGAAIQLLRLRI